MCNFIFIYCTCCVESGKLADDVRWQHNYIPVLHFTDNFTLITVTNKNKMWALKSGPLGTGGSADRSDAVGYGPVKYLHINHIVWYHIFSASVFIIRYCKSSL